jgi:hypothetical protein
MIENRKRENAGNGYSSRRGTCFAGLDHGSNASLQSRKVEHVDDPLVEEMDFCWFKICKGKVVRQNLDPLLESRRSLGVEKPVPMLLRPPTEDYVTEACKRPWRRPGDDIQCHIGIKISIKNCSISLAGKK